MIRKYSAVCCGLLRSALFLLPLFVGISISACRLVEESAPFTPYEGFYYSDDKVILPEEGLIKNKGEVLDIKWTGIKSSTIRIDLWKKKMYYHQVIQVNYTNNGSFQWTIPYETEGSVSYQVKITSERDSTYYIYSEFFTIK